VGSLAGGAAGERLAERNREGRGKPCWEEAGGYCWSTTIRCSGRGCGGRWRESGSYRVVGEAGCAYEAIDAADIHRRR
jgi:hypothetical protein